MRSDYDRLFNIFFRRDRIALWIFAVFVYLLAAAIGMLLSFGATPLNIAILATAASGMVGALAYYFGQMAGRWAARESEEAEKTRQGQTPGYYRPVPEELARSGRLGRVILEKVAIRNFKNIQELKIDLTAQPRVSELTGNWTCIAGINGAGKSSILQAVCLLLLGDKKIPELGGERIRRMLRREGLSQLDIELTAHCRVGEQVYQIYLPISAEGVNERKLMEREDYWLIDAIWQNLQTQLFVSYGATRNLSDRKDSSNLNLSRQVQRQMTLFDPLTQIASVDALLEGGEKSAAALETLRLLLGRVLPEFDLGKAELDSLKRLRFAKEKVSLEALDLPDGFRSTVAWIADLCVAWHEVKGPAARKPDYDPSKITGVVLIDEIDLHLHARLQRELVPNLRTALPNVQFIVTTHSPLVLAGFDRNELVVLDKDVQGGIRQLDRQLFGLTMDEVYEWLMETPPESPIIEQLLRENSPQIGSLLSQSTSTNEEEAIQQVARRRELMRRLQNPDG